MNDLKSGRIIVTGGAGFLGAKVVEEFRKKGAEVAVPRSATCDLRDAASVARLYREFQPTLVVHLAARVGGIGANRSNPGLYFHDNLLMGLNVIEQARVCGRPRVVVAGTICSYPKFAAVPFREEDLWSGYPEETNAPYGIAKKSLFVMAQAYRAQYGMDFVCLLPVNLYGPRDNFDLESSHVIPALIRKCVEARDAGQEHVQLWGDGSPTREFLYVDDCASAIVSAAERCDTSDPINIGTGQDIAIRDLARMIASATGFEGTFEWDATKPNGQPKRCLDVSRAREAFGFTASVSLEEGLRRTVTWYEQYRRAEGGGP